MATPAMLEMHKKAKLDDAYRELLMALEKIPADERQSNIDKAIGEISLKERRATRQAKFNKLSDEEQEQLLAKR
jgi:hypothetical protein